MNRVTIRNANLDVFSLLTNLAAVAFVLLVPVMAHATGLPLYMLEPMRLVIVIALVHRRIKTAYVFATVLPLLSFLFTGHPAMIKMAIITVELISNVFIFNYILSKTGKGFLSMFLSILLSKALCYAVYAVVFTKAFMEGETTMVFLTVQAITTVIFSIYTGYKRKAA